MAGASTNPDPEVFAWSAATVKNCMDATKRLGGSNYVLWGGREGYETLLNTDMKQELEHMGRFLTLVVDYKHKIGFEGQILVEPKPKEPTAHQYDFDVASVYAFLSGSIWRRKSESTSKQITHSWPATPSSTRLQWRRCWAFSVLLISTAEIPCWGGILTSFRTTCGR